jgi:4-hydroxy-2-oxoheptanedioate aldolase
MRDSVIKAKLTRNQPVLLTQLHITDPVVFELASLMGFDGLWMDLEHHSYSEETAAKLMRAARVGRSDILARPAKGEFMKMSRLLESGAQGIMYPRCDDAAEAAEVIKWSKFAPLGKRGLDGGNPDAPYCTMPIPDYIKHANEQTFILIQLEEQSSVDRAQAIAEVEGVDVLFFGPGDFSVLSGIPAQYDHPLVLKAMEKIGAATRKAGKHWGTPGFTPEHSRRLMDMGAMLITHTADIVLIKQGLERIQEQFIPLGFSFQSSLGTK